MADIDLNFSCSDPSLSHSNLTAEVWMIKSEGPAHERAILAGAVFQILFVVVGVPWNAVVLATILMNRLYRLPSYVLLLNLVITDLLLCALNMPFNIASAISQKLTIGKSDYDRCQVCHTFGMILTSLLFTSFFIQALMSVDRLIYVKWPLRYSKYVTVRRTLLGLLVVWLLSIFISVPPAFGFGEIKFANVISSCIVFTVGRTPLTRNSNYLIALVLVGAFPVLTTLTCNIWVLSLIFRSVRGTFSRTMDNNLSQFDSTLQRNDNEQQIHSNYHKQQIRLAKVFGVIFAFNIVTFLPLISIFIVATIGSVPTPVITFVFLIFICQPAIHPILETCLVSKARSVLSKCVCNCSMRRKTDHTTHCTPGRSCSVLA